MATVTLTTVWLNDAADPGDRVKFSKLAELTRTPAKAGRVQRTAGGRLRIISRAGTPTAWELDLPWCTAEQLAWLEAHLGRTVCARDDQGHKLFGVFLELPVVQHPPHIGGGDVELTVQQVTWSEAV